jgi:hypothetical protein
VQPCRSGVLGRAAVPAVDTAVIRLRRVRAARDYIFL